MKLAYADIIHWLRFNAAVMWREIRLCNDGCVSPLVKPFVAGDKPDAGYPVSILPILEEEVGS